MGPGSSKIIQRRASPVVVAIRRRVQVETRFEHGVANRGAGVPSKAEAVTVGPVVAVESVSWLELLGKGVDSEMVVATAKAFVKPVPPLTDMAITKAKTVSAAGEIDPRPAQPSAGATDAKS